jgi:hypothetical protein
VNVAEVMAELATAVDTIDGLNTFPFWADRIEPPAAVVAWPEPYDFDATMARGSDSATFPLVVLVGKVDDASAAIELGAYCDGSGARSIKEVIEAHAPTAYDVATVESVEFAVTSVAGVEYLAATFAISIVGTGE